MTKNIWFASDHHFGDERILSYLNDDGSRVRPFDSLDEMHELLINNHNSVVQPSDKVYFLGDVVVNKKYLSILERLNGHKRIVLGNHDVISNQYPSCKLPATDLSTGTVGAFKVQSLPD